MSERCTAGSRSEACRSIAPAHHPAPRPPVPPPARVLPRGRRAPLLPPPQR
jgi:hypothetical protein